MVEVVINQNKTKLSLSQFKELLFREDKTPLLKNNISSNRNKDFMSVYNKESLKIVEKIYEKDINIYKQLRSGDYKCQKLVEKNSHILKKV